MNYNLDGKIPVPCESENWVYKDRTENLVQTELAGDVRIGTVFLGVDLNRGKGKPLFFKSRVFGGSLDGEVYWYETWNEAIDGHEKLVLRVKQAQAQAQP